MKTNTKRIIILSAIGLLGVGIIAMMSRKGSN